MDETSLPVKGCTIVHVPTHRSRFHESTKGGVVTHRATRAQKADTGRSNCRSFLETLTGVREYLSVAVSDGSNRMPNVERKLRQASASSSSTRPGFLEPLSWSTRATHSFRVRNRFFAGCIWSVKRVVSTSGQGPPGRRQAQEELPEGPQSDSISMRQRT